MAKEVSVLDWLHSLLGGGDPEGMGSAAASQAMAPIFGGGNQLAGLPPAVRRSILQAPSYGEGDVIPSRDLTALRQEYASNPITNQRTDALNDELGMLDDLRNRGTVYPEARNPWASAWAPQSPYARPQGGIPPQMRGLLSLY